LLVVDCKHSTLRQKNGTLPITVSNFSIGIIHKWNIGNQSKLNLLTSWVSKFPVFPLR
jgi:hypothetical protein